MPMDRGRRGRTRAEVVPAHAHLVGIAGRGMSGLAQMLVRRGVKVTGSERDVGPIVDRLRRLGVRVHAGHAPPAWPRAAGWLICAPEIGRAHPDRLVADRLGIARGSPLRWLKHLNPPCIGLAVAGRRDAGAASAMIGWTLVRAGLDPTVVLGRAVPQLGGWARLGSGSHFVVEAIAGPDGLGPLGPAVAVLLDVPPGIGSGPAATAEALRQFAASVPPAGLIVAREGSGPVEEALRGLATTVERIALERGSDWWGADLREERGRFRFRVFRRGRFAVEIRLQVPGLRNVRSALAAVAACNRLALPTADIKQGLEEFDGLSRDFESRGSYRGVTLIDDECQDASAVSETLAIGRQVFGARRLWAVFLPAGVGIAPEDVGPLLAALAVADHVLVTEGRPTAASDRGASGSRSLVRSLLEAGVRARWMASLDDAISDLDRHLEPGDVLLTVGAGDVGTIADAFIRRLSRHRQGR